MKGIILAGGTGTRLYPITCVLNKQLLPVHDKPLIYYPLTTLISSGVSEICIIANNQEIEQFRELLGNGHKFGIKLEYREQPSPEGIPQAFTIASDFIGQDHVCLILGDNIFVDSGEIRSAIRGFRRGASIFGYQVKDPRQFGVIEFDGLGRPKRIVEKPKSTTSNTIIPGLYLYDSKVIFHAATLRPSARGELEISDINNIYLAKNSLKVNLLSRGSTWIDAGTPDALSRATNYILTIQTNHGLKIGCPEEAALVRGFIEEDNLEQELRQIKDCEYKRYLTEIIGSRRGRRGLEQTINFASN